MLKSLHSFTYIPENEGLEVEKSASIYYSVIFLFLAGNIGASILIDDLTLVFGVISGVSECLIIFILPSFFYLRANKMAVARQLTGEKNLTEE